MVVWQGSRKALEWETLLKPFWKIQSARITQCCQVGDKISNALKGVFWIWWFRGLWKSKESGMSGVKED